MAHDHQITSRDNNRSSNSFDNTARKNRLSILPFDSSLDALANRRFLIQASNYRERRNVTPGEKKITRRKRSWLIKKEVDETPSLKTIVTSKIQSGEREREREALKEKIRRRWWRRCRVSRVELKRMV